MGGLIDMVQTGAGRNWWPDYLWLIYARPLERDQRDWLGSARVYQGAPCTAVFVPADLLTRPCEIPPCFVLDTRPALAKEFLFSLRHTLTCEVLQGRTALNALARASDMHPRTLQRRIARAGISFQVLLDEVRMEIAIPLVREGGAPLLDVALKLGYRDAAAFSRAFRRWTGLSPSEFRQNMSEEPARLLT